MSILSDLKNKKISWGTAAKEVEQWASNIVAKSPAMQALAGSLLSIVKQGASNAIAAGDNALDAVLEPVSQTVESVLDAALLKALGPAAALVTPGEHAVVQDIASWVKAEADAWTLKVLGQLAPAPAATQGGSVSGTLTAPQPTPSSLT